MQSYAITLTLKPMYYKYTIDQQYHYMRNELEDVQGIKFNVIFELTKSYNVHAHGIIELTKSNKYSQLRQLYDKFRLCDRIGFVMIKPIDDLKVWSDYCYKDVEKTCMEINNPIKINSLDYLFPNYLSQFNEEKQDQQ